MNAYRAQLGVALEGGLIPVGSQVLVGPGPDQILEAWRQQGFQRKLVAVIDPKDRPSSDLKPRDWVTLLFTGKPNKEWASWMKKNGVELVEKPDLTKDRMRGLLIGGAFGFKLTPEAADFVSEYFGDDSANRFFSTMFVLQMVRSDESPQAAMDMDTLADLWPDTGIKNARDITHALGTVKALKVFLRVPRTDSESIFGLWAYLEIICKTKKPELLNVLHHYRNACDRLKFDYWEGIWLFLHHCYKEATWRSKSPTTGSSSSRRRSTPSQDLSRRCGIGF